LGKKLILTRGKNRYDCRSSGIKEGKKENPRGEGRALSSELLIQPSRSEEERNHPRKKGEKDWKSTPPLHQKARIYLSHKDLLEKERKRRRAFGGICAEGDNLLSNKGERTMNHAGRWGL